MFPKYIRIFYVIIFDIIFSFFYGLYFLISLKKAKWRKLFAIGLQICENILLIILFCVSTFNHGNDKQLFNIQDYYDYIYLILDLILNFIK